MSNQVTAIAAISKFKSYIIDSVNFKSNTKINTGYIVIIHVPVFFQDSSIHRFLFWVAISVLQLDEQSLYTAGLALLEQNLHTLDNMGLFDREVHRRAFLCFKVYITERKSHTFF